MPRRRSRKSRAAAFRRVRVEARSEARSSSRRRPRCRSSVPPAPSRAAHITSSAASGECEPSRSVPARSARRSAARKRRAARRRPPRRERPLSWIARVEQLPACPRRCRPCRRTLVVGTGPRRVKNAVRASVPRANRRAQSSTARFAIASRRKMEDGVFIAEHHLAAATPLSTFNRRRTPIVSRLPRRDAPEAPSRPPDGGADAGVEASWRRCAFHKAAADAASRFGRSHCEASWRPSAKPRRSHPRRAVARHLALSGILPMRRDWRVEGGPPETTATLCVDEQAASAGGGAGGRRAQGPACSVGCARHARWRLVLPNGRLPRRRELWIARIHPPLDE